MEGTAAITGGTLAFGGSQAFIYAKSSNTISAAITGTNGLTLTGSGTLTLSVASPGLSGEVTVDSGTLSLTAANVFSTDVAGLILGDVKSSPSNSILNFTASQSFTTLDSVGNKSAITFNGSAALTVGDTTNNLSSTLSSSITETGAATAGALTFNGSGMFDLSGISSGKLSLVAGSSIIANNTAILRVVASEFSSAAVSIVLNGTSQLQFVQNGGGQFADAISGTGKLHLIGGTLQLTGTNSYSGGTVVETGSTLDLTTANVSTGNANITDAGGLIVFDQSTNGTYSGVISDGLEMGTGPMMAGSLDKDDSSGNNSGNVTLTAVQTYSGATYIEAGTLTLGAANAIADSSGVILGRVGGGGTATLALGANNQLNSLSDNASNTTSVLLNGHTLTLTPVSGTDSTFGGVIGDGTGAGSLVVNGVGVVTLNGNNSFTGGTTIDTGSTLEIGAAATAGSGAITFSGTGDTLKLDGTTMPSNTLSGFVASDKIDLAGIAFDNTGSVNLIGGNDLRITENGHTYDLQLNPAQGFGGDFFHLANDGNSGSMITEDATPCYCRGTLIRTPDGDRPVESLGIGDLIVTVGGAALPLKWIGRRSYCGWLAVGNKNVQPILFKAGSIADQVPARDLYVSPEHAMFIDGMLIPAFHLVNGISILKMSGVEEIDYFHLEFDRHVVILAENAPAESFVDDESRMLFHNAAEYRQLYPNTPRRAWAEFCAPRLEDGYELYALQQALTARATHLRSGSVDTPLSHCGKAELVTSELISSGSFSDVDIGPLPRPFW